MNAQGFFRYAQAQGLDLEGVCISNNTVNFTNVDSARQAVVMAAFAVYDSSKDDWNDQIDQQILAIEREADSPRRRREALVTQQGRDWMAAREAEIMALRQQRQT